MTHSIYYHKLFAFLLFMLSLSLAACSKSSSSPPAPINLSGTISIASGANVDSDINDPFASYASNDSIESPQVILNPTTLGGYVNVANAGATGRSFSNGDTDDYFSTVLAASQVVTLEVSESTASLGLSLEDGAGSIVQSPAQNGSTQRITVATSGTYLIHVKAISGASNYILSIGIGVASSVARLNSDLSIDDDFVPGDIIVRFKDAANTTVQNGLNAQAAMLNLKPKAGAAGRDMLMSLGDKAQTINAFAALGVALSDVQDVDPVIQKKRDTLTAIIALRARRDVLTASPNYILKAFAVPNDQYYNLQWDYPLMNLPAAWEVTTGQMTGTKEVIVAVVDTGVLLNHPDLQGKLVPGYDFIRDVASAGDGNGIDPNPDDVGDGDGIAIASSFHGTHVAGTIAAATNNTTGVAGIGWNVKVMPLRALGKGGGNDYDVAQAIRYAAGLANDSETVPSLVADVINLSLGGPSHSSALDQAISDARAAGVIIVAAAGNETSQVLFYPAALPGVVSVSAVDMNKALVYYSNFGATIDVAAPGGDMTKDINGDSRPDGILSTVGDDSAFNGTIKFSYGFYQGTSMAAPHVAGVAALMKAVKPAMTPADFDAYLASGSITEDLGVPGRDDDYGYGFIDAYKAVTAAGGQVPVIPALAAVSPSALNFSYASDTLTFTITNAGNQPFASLSSSIAYNGASGWLTVAPTVSGVGTYTATVDRSVLAGSPDNVHVANIVITADSNTVNVPVIMALSNLGITENAGLHYAILFDANATLTTDNTQQLELTASNGKYTFQFNDVVPGAYFLVAGTDNDNDFAICDSGEACGIYADATNIVKITVTAGQASVSNLNFQTSYSNLLSGLSLNLGSHTIERFHTTRSNPVAIRRKPVH